MDEATSSRPALLKKLLVFQFKLALDTLRDLVLSPVSIFLAMVDMIHNTRPEDSHLSRLMAWGHRTDEFINLFEHADDHAQTVDGVVDQVEATLKRPKP